MSASQFHRSRLRHMRTEIPRSFEPLQKFPARKKSHLDRVIAAWGDAFLRLFDPKVVRISQQKAPNRPRIHSAINNSPDDEP